MGAGEWDPNTSLLARRMNELKGRRAYLKNFWYAAAISEEVKEAPVGVELCGEKVVLFRGKDGQVSVCFMWLRRFELAWPWLSKVCAVVTKVFRSLVRRVLKGKDGQVSLLCVSVISISLTVIKLMWPWLSKCVQSSSCHSCLVRLSYSEVGMDR